MASLISVAITHAVIRLLTRTHANGLCSHLDVQSAGAGRCSAVYRLLDFSLRLRWSDITQKKKIEGNASVVHTECSPVCCWLTARIPEILCRCVIALGQEPTTGVWFAFPSSTFPWLSAICLPPHVIPHSALNYWPQCAVSWDHGCSFLLSTRCSRDILAIAEISAQNENIIGFIRFILNR